MKTTLESQRAAHRREPNPAYVSGRVGAVGMRYRSLKWQSGETDRKKFLADLLVQLSDRQLEDMFEAGRIQLRPRDPASGRSGFPDAQEWVSAFKHKRAQIVERSCEA